MTKPVSEYFQNQGALRQALVHRSYLNEHDGFEVSNERLEFLGDAVLSLVISDRLYKLLPDVPEGELTARRSYLVQTASLAAKARQLHLDEMLLLSRGEEDSGGRRNSGLLANTFEAVLGALYLDSGLDHAGSFLTDVFPDSEITAHYQIKDPKSLLQELSQAKGWGTPGYYTVTSVGPDHAKLFTIGVSIDNRQVAVGEGSSKQRAEVAAAKAALASLFKEADI